MGYFHPWFALPAIEDIKCCFPSNLEYEVTYSIKQLNFKEKKEKIQTTNRIGMFTMGCYVVIQLELICSCALNGINTQTSIPLG